jgi:hypothetical protein
MIKIEKPENTIYWIFKNNNNQYVKGKTNPTQTTNAGDMWNLYFQTTDEVVWNKECEKLGLKNNI